MSGIEAKVVEDSISPNGERLTTLQLKFHRFILSEFNTHRVFSRNASSSRAIPVSKMLSQVWNDPAMPVYWGKNKSGMQAKEELTGIRRKWSEFVWRFTGKVACCFAWTMVKLNLHKQTANRILEAWMMTNVVVTSTEWQNFFLLRDHHMAQPEIRVLAKAIKEAMACSIPKKLEYGQWHLPYVSNEEKDIYTLNDCLKMSTARCARVSYMKHDKTQSSLEEDSKLHDTLVVSEPRHSSPSEHQATPSAYKGFIKNFRGWYQYRAKIEGEKNES